MGAGVIGELVRAALLLSTLQAQPVHPVRAMTPAGPVIAPVGPAADAWLGSDKFQHFAMSYATTAFAFAAAASAGRGTDGSLAVAVPAGALAGIGKEVIDRRRGGMFSTKDLVADALGVAAAWLILREVH